MTNAASLHAGKVSRPRSPREPAKAVLERDTMRRAFLAMALSHEVKQPLNSLNLNVELLAKRLARGALSGAEAAGPLEALGRLADRITACVDTFCDHVRPEPVPEKPVALDPLLAAAVARAARSARGRGVKVVLEVEGALVPVPAHAGQIGLALDEVLGNAVAASARGQVVTLRAMRKADEVRISIEDRGGGMTPEVTRRAIEIGFSTRGAEGIGLTVAKFVAYHHAGGFQIVSVFGTGTTVTLALPIA